MNPTSRWNDEAVTRPDAIRKDGHTYSNRSTQLLHVAQWLARGGRQIRQVSTPQISREIDKTNSQVGDAIRAIGQSVKRTQG